MKRKHKTIETLGRVVKTGRGFEAIDFKDMYDNPCSLQQSSVAIYESPGASAVWLGNGEQRMHLSRGHVRALIGHLERWLKDNTFEMSE